MTVYSKFRETEIGLHSNAFQITRWTFQNSQTVTIELLIDYKGLETVPVYLSLHLEKTIMFL